VLIYINERLALCMVCVSVCVRVRWVARLDSEVADIERHQIARSFTVCARLNELTKRHLLESISI
jgi:hypothetical protein